MCLPDPIATSNGKGHLSQPGPGRKRLYWVMSDFMVFPLNDKSLAQAISIILYTFEEINIISASDSQVNPPKKGRTNELFLVRAIAYSMLGQQDKVVPDVTEYLRPGPTRTKDVADCVSLT